MGKNRQGEEYSFDWNYDMFSPYLSFEGENLNEKKMEKVQNGILMKKFMKENM